MLTWKCLTTVLLLLAPLVHSQACTPGSTFVSSLLLDQQIQVTYRDYSCVSHSVLQSTDPSTAKIYNPVTIFDLIPRAKYNISLWAMDWHCNEDYPSMASCEYGCLNSEDVASAICRDSESDPLSQNKEIDNYCVSYFPRRTDLWHSYTLKPLNHFTVSSKAVATQPAYTPTVTDALDPYQTTPFRLVNKLTLGQFYSSSLGLTSVNIPTGEYSYLPHIDSVVAAKDIGLVTGSGNVTTTLPDLDQTDVTCESFQEAFIDQEWDDEPIVSVPFTTEVIGLPALAPYTLVDLKYQRKAVLTMNGYQIISPGMDPIIDPCSSTAFHVRFDAANNPQGLIFDPSYAAQNPCIVIYEEQVDDSRLARFEAVSGRFTPFEEWVGAVSLNYVQAYSVRAVTALNLASDGSVYSPSIYSPRFNIDYASSASNIVVSLSAAVTCTFWISPTCTKQATFSTSIPSVSLDLSNCGSFNDKGRFRCGISDGFFELPVQEQDDRLLVQKLGLFDSLKQWVHKMKRGDKKRGKKIRERLTDFTFAGNFTRALYVIFTLVFAIPLTVFAVLELQKRKPTWFQRRKLQQDPPKSNRREKLEEKNHTKYEIAATTSPVLSPTGSVSNLNNNY